MVSGVEVREPVVAGQFYPALPSELKKLIASFIDKEEKKTDSFGCILPHAGYIYSGRVATLTLSRMNIKERVILLGPNHTGYGKDFSIMTEGLWQTPLGEVGIDTELARGLLDCCRHLKEDKIAHRYEHSLEVELPILQYLGADFKIVPIAFLSDDLEILKEIGQEIGRAIQENAPKDEIILIASSDMTHYEPQEEAEKKDRQAIEAILELDADKLMERIRHLDISMCGYAPVIVMLSCAKVLGAKSGRLINYQTSGNTTGDFASVVGYAGIIIY